jgi:hypothetical protein
MGGVPRVDRDPIASREARTLTPRRRSMKKNTQHDGRILGRLRAREISHEELHEAAGVTGAQAGTWTLRYPPDKDADLGEL